MMYYWMSPPDRGYYGTLNDIITFLNHIATIYLLEIFLYLSKRLFKQITIEFQSNENLSIYFIPHHSTLIHFREKPENIRRTIKERITPDTRQDRPYKCRKYYHKTAGKNLHNSKRK